MATYEIETEDGAYQIETEDSGIESVGAELSADFGTGEKDFSFLEAAKQSGSGLFQGNLGALGFLADLNPMQAGGPKLDFPTTTALAEGSEPYMADRDPRYRFLRTASEFVGPSLGLKVAGGGLKLFGKAPAAVKAIEKLVTKTALAQDVAGGVGAQVAEDIAPDNAIAPIIGGLLGSGSVSVAKNALGVTKDTAVATRNIFLGRSPTEIRARAAQVLRDSTNIDEVKLAKQIEAMPDNELRQFVTTAELTEDAGMAGIQAELSGSDVGKQKYNKAVAARERARQGMISSEDMSTTLDVTDEALGQRLIDEGALTRQAMSDEAERLWKEVPRHKKIDVSLEQGQLIRTMDKRQAGKEISGAANKRIDEFLDQGSSQAPKKGTQTSGYLQDTRSKAMERLREPNVGEYETRLLTQLTEQIDDAMARGLKGDDYDLWKAARDQTSEMHERFKVSTAGGRLTREGIQPYRAFKNALLGDVKSAKELKKAIRNNPEVMEDVKRALLNRIKKDSKGRLSLSNVQNFLSANDGALREIFDAEHVANLKVIAGDLLSEAKLDDLAFGASRRGSVTAQKTSVGNTIRSALAGVVLPAGGKVANKAISWIAEKASIKTVEQVEEVLFEAAMDPKFARDLLLEPTAKNVTKATERLMDIVQSGARGGALGLFTQGSKNGTTENDNDISGSKKKVEASVNLPEKSSVETLVDKAATDTGIPPELLNSIVKQESNFKPTAKSSVGALGLMQLMPATAKEEAERAGLTDYDLTDPETNLLLGTQYYKRMLDRFDGDHELALTAYHSGPGRVSKLLRQTGGSTLADIKDKLGPVGKKYAEDILGRLG